MNSESSEAAPPATLNPAHLARIRSSASWFFWIAALSIVNSVIGRAGGEWFSVAGLGVTQFADEFLSGAGSAGNLTALCFVFLVAGACAVLGFHAREPQVWPFVVGIVLYSLDALLFVWVRAWLSVAFHGFVLYQLSVGLRLLYAARAVQRQT